MGLRREFGQSRQLLQWPKSPHMSQPSALSQLPPHSIEAEQCVLGCIMLAPDCLEQCGDLTPEHFYDIRHRIIWRALNSVDVDVIDSVTVRQWIRDNGLEEAAGGVAYWSSFPDLVPTAANLDYYLSILFEKEKLRRLVTLCAETISAVYSGATPDKLIEAAAEDFAGFQSTKNKDQIWSAKELANYEVAADPNAILGVTSDGKPTRFLCRGGSAWLIAQTGAGKSSLLMQMAIGWTLGLPFCGLGPVRDLRVLIVQAENDKGDAAEQFQGAVDGMQIGRNSDEFEAIQSRLQVIQSRQQTGAVFCRWLERAITQWRADLVIVDPLLSFAGIEVSRQDQCSKFLRETLDRVLDNTGVVFLAAHHTTKPRRDVAKESPSPFDQAYSGLGSSELVNWARAIMLLSAVDGSVFRLAFAKRGDRAGTAHPTGEPAAKPLCEVWLRRAIDRIFWQQIAPPEPSASEGKSDDRKKTIAERVLAQNLYTFLEGCKVGGEKLRPLSMRLCTWLASADAQDRISGLNATGRAVRGAVEALVNVGWLAQRDDGKNQFYVRGERK